MYSMLSRTKLVYMCVLFSTFVCFVLFCVLCVIAVGCGYSAPNEDIKRSKCGAEKSYTFLHTFS